MEAVLYNILLVIDGAIYDLVDYVYDIFDFLAKINIFDNDMYGEITSKIYVILGLIMMFILAYSLLKAVINPDDYAKGEQSITKLIPNVLISLAIIVLLPTVFSFAMNFQEAILNNDTIPNFILGETNQDNVEDGSIDNDNGRMISYYAFQAFLHPNEEYCTSEGMSYDECAASDKIKGNGSWFVSNGDPYSEVDANVRAGNSFRNYNVFGEAVRDGKMTYYYLISTIAGIFLLWVLANYCFDMAVRVIKLAFYQLIAPIPVICRILPGGKSKDVFDKWTKQTISTYLEVFIRIAIMSIGIFLLRLVINAVNNNQIAGLSELRIDKKFIVIALLIMGIIIFIRQAPKLIGDIFHLDTGGMKLGLMDKLAMGGALTAGAVAGGGATMFARNTVSGFRKMGANFKEAKGIGRVGAIAGGLIGTAGSVAAGTVSGAARSGKAGLKAKNFKDMAGAASSGAAAAGMAKAKRDAYRASHKINKEDLGKLGSIPFVGAAAAGALSSLNTGLGHIKDTGGKAAQWAGINMGLDALNHEKSVADEMMGFYKTMAGYVEDNEMVANYAGLYEAERKSEISDTVFDSRRYQESLNARVSMMQNDSKYRGMNTNELYNLAASEIDKNQFTRKRTASEMQAAIEERQTKLKMYDNLKKMATIKAVNEKLNEKSADGTIIDGRFQAVANQVEVFKKQNASFDFVRDMHSIEGVTWDSSWDAIMNSGDADAINTLMKDFKSSQSPVSFFGDSEMGKNKSGEISAQIATKIQEKKKDGGK